MKKISFVFWIISWVVSSAFATPFNECKIDMYFGNGVWNIVENVKSYQNLMI